VDGRRVWNVAILGPGGVGGLLGALFARAGHRVVCLAGGETVEVVRRDGIRVRSGQFGDFTAEVDADTELREAVDLCLIAVKNTALSEAVERVSSEVLGDGLVVPLLNGIEHPALLRKRYRPDLVVPGVARVESTRVAAGVIVHGSPFLNIELASATAGSDRLETLAEVLRTTGADVRLQEDETAALWGKMSFFAPLALLTTLHGLTVGGVRTERRADLLELVEEIAAVSRACGVPIDTAATVRAYDSFPGDGKSSMQRDAESGRPLELDAIGGAVLRAAEQHALSVPLTKRVVAELVRAGY